MYTPALQRTQNRGVVDKLIFQNEQVLNENVVVDHVANFVEGVRAKLEVAKRNDGNQRDQEEAGPSTGRREVQTKKDRVTKQADFAKNLASEQVIAAEKFKSDINQPQGKSATLDINQPFEKLFIETAKKYFAGVERPRNDCEIIEEDDFFHITCHVEIALMQKIEKGEYVDLERLLVHDRFTSRSNEERLEFVSREGQTFLTSATNKEPRINGIRHWKQAFCVYAAIYSKANPERASEIWQYIHTINTAASNFVWENVAYYDFTF